MRVEIASVRKYHRDITHKTACCAGLITISIRSWGEWKLRPVNDSLLLYKIQISCVCILLFVYIIIYGLLDFVYGCFIYNYTSACVAGCRFCMHFMVLCSPSDERRNRKCLEISHVPSQASQLIALLRTKPHFLRIMKSSLLLSKIESFGFAKDESIFHDERHSLWCKYQMCRPRKQKWTTDDRFRGSGP